ncbi:MAG: hypothetical protein KIT80_20785 [Chitinophagaceae bacterium]|nr:hypothetical protein [Chitinophagaceae bacterium]MCW5929369.1 hypothetical protein [Chitinophagaceae bacterium]
MKVLIYISAVFLVVTLVSISNELPHDGYLKIGYPSVFYTKAYTRNGSFSSFELTAFFSNLFICSAAVVVCRYVLNLIKKKISIDSE